MYALGGFTALIINPIGVYSWQHYKPVMYQFVADQASRMTWTYPRGYAHGTSQMNFSENCIATSLIPLKGD